MKKSTSKGGVGGPRPLGDVGDHGAFNGPEVHPPAEHVPAPAAVLVVERVDYAQVRASVSALAKVGGRAAVVAVLETLGVEHASLLLEEQWGEAVSRFDEARRQAEAVRAEHQAKRAAHFAREMTETLPPRALTEEGIAATALRIADIAPADPIEEMLATQMLALHNASLDCTRRAYLADFEDVRRDNLNMGCKASRAFVALVEALDRHRRGGEQKVTVEHVHVHAGGQAIVGAVTAGGGGRLLKGQEQSDGT